MTEEVAPLPTGVLELVYERSHLHAWGRYDPREDLLRRKGVDLKWHNDTARFGKGFTGKVWGLTSFTDLSVSLHVRLSEVQLRCTTAHECAHLDRGPVPAEKTKREEAAVNLLAAQRLIDPIVFDALMEATKGNPTKHARYATVGVDRRLFMHYVTWRRRVTNKTAERRWEQARRPTSWPPRWLEEEPDSFPIAARFAGR